MFRYYKILLFLTILLSINIINVLSQSKNTKKADELFNKCEYFSALEEYQDLLKDENLRAEKAYLNFKSGECYKFINEDKKAELWYGKAIRAKYENKISLLYLADIKLKNEKYIEADSTYKNYLKLFPNDERAKAGIASCSLVVEWTNNPSRYTVENMQKINSRDDEFCAVYGSNNFDIIYFSSTRQSEKKRKTSNYNGLNYSNIFEIKVDDKDKWSIPVSLSKSINSEIDNSCNSLNPNTETMYLTRGEYVKGIKPINKIYLSRKVGLEDWNEADIITIANDTISVSHPSATKDELTIYFASDLPGGFGGSDIWMITKSDKSKPWGAPINLGKDINTAGDEMFPFIREDGKLYFSSNGLAGMGGLDIFCATKKGNSWTIKNMKSPINSSGDDYSIVFKGSKDEGLFTSNRVGGKGGDDIYSFELPPIEYILNGKVTDELTGNQITNYIVSVIGNDGTDYETTSLTDGSFKVNLDPKVDYIYIIKKEGYFNGKGKVSTKGLTDSKTFENEIKLKPVTENN